MRKTSCCLCQIIINLILLKLLTPPPDIYMTNLILISKVSKGAKIRNRYNQVPHMTQDIDIDNPCFDQTVSQIYPIEFQLNKANSSDTEAPFLDLNLSITKSIVSSKILVWFPSPRSTYLGSGIG